MDELLTLTVYKDGEETPYKAKLKEPLFHEIEWAVGLQETIGTVKAGDRFLNTIWEDGDETIRQDTELRTKAAKSVWNLAPVGAADLEEQEDGSYILKVWNSDDERLRGFNPMEAKLKQAGFEEIADATAKQEDEGTVSAGQYLLDELAIKEESSSAIWDETRALLTACLRCFRICPAGTAQIEKESKGIGDSSSKTSSESEQPSSDTIGKEEG